TQYGRRHRNPGGIAGELFKMMTGVNMLRVPYRGAAPALTDLLGGQVQVMFATMSSSMEYVRAAPPGGDQRNALGRTSRHSSSKRFRTWLRGNLMVWRRRTSEHAGRDYWEAERRNQRGAC